MTTSTYGPEIQAKWDNVHKKISLWRFEKHGAPYDDINNAMDELIKYVRSAVLQEAKECVPEKMLFTNHAGVKDETATACWNSCREKTLTNLDKLSHE